MKEAKKLPCFQNASGVSKRNSTKIFSSWKQKKLIEPFSAKLYFCAICFYLEISNFTDIKRQDIKIQDIETKSDWNITKMLCGHETSLLKIAQ